MSHARPAGLRDALSGLAGRAAVAAGTLVRWSRGRRARLAARAAPALSGGSLGAVGLGEVAGHVFGRGLAPWVACCVAAVFLIRIGAELNAPPPRPQPDGE